GALLIVGNYWGQFRRLKIEPAKHATGDLPYELRVVGEPVNAEYAKWAPPFEFSGRRVFASASQDKVRIWDVAELLEDGPIIEDDPLCSMAADISAAHLIATGNASGQTRIWDWRAAEQKWTDTFSERPISSLAIARTTTRSLLAAGDSIGRLFIYDLSLGLRLREPIQVGERIEDLTGFVMDGAAY